MEIDNSAKTADATELGSVCGETRGPMGEMLEVVGFWHRTGLSAE